MGLGDGIAQGIQAGQMLFRPITDRFAEKRRLAQEMQMFNAKNQAELAQHLALKKADSELAMNQRKMALESLAKRFGGQEAEQAQPQAPTNLAIPQTPEAPQTPSLDQISQVAQSQAPQAPKVPSMEAWNPKKWQAENYQDYVDEKGFIDEKGFRQGLKSASDEYQKQQYAKSLGYGDVPSSVMNSPMFTDVVRTKQEARKVERDKSYVTQYAKRNGLNLSPEEIEAYASRPGVIEAIQSNKEQERRFTASEAHRTKSEANAEARLAKYLAPKASGGGRVGGRGSVGKPLKRFNPETNSYVFYDSKTGRPMNQDNRPMPPINITFPPRR